MMALQPDEMERLKRELLSQATTEPGTEVDIDLTSEMIAAGAAVIDDLCPGHASYPWYVAEQVFRAMLDRLPVEKDLIPDADPGP